MVLQSVAKLSRNVSAIAADAIREAIVQGEIKPGERLKEAELASSLSISRTPVREALLILQSEGLIQTLPNQGAVVREFSREELNDLYELRAVLEGYASRRAAQRASKRMVAELERKCAAVDELLFAGEVAQANTANFDLHLLIVSAGEGARLREIVQSALRVPQLYRSYVQHDADDRVESSRMHHRIVAAIKAGEADRAEWLMKEHIIRGRDIVLRTFRQDLA